MATIFRGFSTVDKIRAPYSLFDQELIKRDLLNEFQTRRGERLMKPNFGSIIHDLLMEPEDTITDDEIRDDITRICDKDPRKQFLHAYRFEGKTKYKPVIGKAKDLV